MDISVSHLNNRLALQLPPELPLGLVFVVGQVSAISEFEASPIEKTPQKVYFELLEDNYRLPCILSPRAVTEVNLVEGDRIRAGGHLIFDTERAAYHLLARDVEIIESEPELEPAVKKQVGRTALTPILADIKKRSETAQIAQAELPVWVQRMAPPEVQAEMEDMIDEGVSSPLPDVAERDPATHLDDDLVSFLSDAMEDLEDVEITSEVLENISPDVEPAAVSPEKAAAYEVPPPAPAPAAPRPPAATERARQNRGMDWFVWLLLAIALVFLLTLVILLVVSNL